MRSARSTPSSAAARLSKSFSTPRWTNQSRALRREDGFPDDGEAEVPGFDEPGVDRSDGDLVDTRRLRRCGTGSDPALSKCGGRPASRRIGCQFSGQWAWRTSRRGRGCPTGMMPNRSAISRSNRLAGNESSASDGTRGRRRVRLTCSSTRRSGVPARNRYTTRSKCSSSWAATKARRKPSASRPTTWPASSVALRARTTRWVPA